MPDPWVREPWVLLFRAIPGRVTATGQVTQVTCQMCGRSLNPMRALLSKHATEHEENVASGCKVRLATEPARSPHYKRWFFR